MPFGMIGTNASISSAIICFCTFPDWWEQTTHCTTWSSQIGFTLHNRLRKTSLFFPLRFRSLFIALQPSPSAVADDPKSILCNSTWMTVASFCIACSDKANDNVAISDWAKLLNSHGFRYRYDLMHLTMEQTEKSKVAELKIQIENVIPIR